MKILKRKLREYHQKITKRFSDYALRTKADSINIDYHAYYVAKLDDRGLRLVTPKSFVYWKQAHLATKRTYGSQIVKGSTVIAKSQRVQQKG